MKNINELVRPDEAILVLGSINANLEDRCTARDKISPVQVIIDGQVKKVKYFQLWGEMGVSALTPIKDDWTSFFLTTGNDLFKINIDRDRGITTNCINIDNLKDVHEITLIDNILWLANTGYDEVIAYNINKQMAQERVRLEKFRSQNKISRVFNTDISEIDTFHCNQAFKGYDNFMYVLTHHASGRQLIKRIAKKLKKQHGDGGVINIDTNEAYDLNLRGPHTVRKLNDQYWIFDSGSSTINIYDHSWKLLQKLPTKGWGRGADFSTNSGLYYAGISETRKRYREKNSEAAIGNLVQVFSIKNLGCVGEIPIPDGIEQVNNVYVIPRQIASQLLTA